MPHSKFLYKVKFNLNTSAALGHADSCSGQNFTWFWVFYQPHIFQDRCRTSHKLINKNSNASYLKSQRPVPRMSVAGRLWQHGDTHEPGLTQLSQWWANSHCASVFAKEDRNLNVSVLAFCLFCVTEKYEILQVSRNWWVGWNSPKGDRLRESKWRIHPSSQNQHAGSFHCFVWFSSRRRGLERNRLDGEIPSLLLEQKASWAIVLCLEFWVSGLVRHLLPEVLLYSSQWPQNFLLWVSSYLPWFCTQSLLSLTELGCEPQLATGFYVLLNRM